MSNAPKKPFFQRTWVMILLLLFFAPVGIFLIWKNCPRWHPAVKAGLSLMFGLIWIGAVLGGGGSAEPSKNVPQSVVDTDRSTPSQETESQPELDATETQPDTSDDAIKADPAETPQDFTITEPENPDPEPEPTPDRSTPTPGPEPEPEPDRSSGGGGSSGNAGSSQEPSNPVSTDWVYVGSIESDKYHYPSCQHAKKILAENLIGWNTIAEAEAAGYKPCGVCHPH